MSSSTYRKAAPRRTHQERSQPKAREKFGLLEKKKDYKLRAKDYHKKEDALQRLRQKAANRNPDEFYFGMIKTSTDKNGGHVKARVEGYDHESQALMKTQDAAYIQLQQSINLKKISRIQENIHIFEEVERGEVTKKSSNKNHIKFEEEKEDVSGSSSSSKKRRHSKEEEDDSQQQQEEVGAKSVASSSQSKVSPETEKEWKKARRLVRAELESRLKRAEKLKKVQLELNIQKSLMGKGSRKKVKVDELGLPVYKWASRRQR